MITRRAHPVLQAWYGVMVAALVWAQPAAADTPTDVCVSLTGSNGQVAGLQIDLKWDPSCMTAQSAGGSAADCTSNRSTGKNVQTAISQDGSIMRALFLSVSDQSPLSDDELFCCKFAAAGSRTVSCCSVTTSNVIFSDPYGKRVYDPTAQLHVTVGGGAPCVSSSAGGSADHPVQPAPLNVPAVQPPAVYAPAVPAAPGGQVPAAPVPLPRPNVPAGAPPVPIGEAAPPAEQVPPPGEQLAPPTAPLAATAAPTRPLTPSVSQPTRTLPRTPIPATATAPMRTPQPQATATVAVRGSATPQAATPTPKSKAKTHKKKRPSAE